MTKEKSDTDGYGYDLLNILSRLDEIIKLLKSINKSLPTDQEHS